MRLRRTGRQRQSCAVARPESSAKKRAGRRLRSCSTKIGFFVAFSIIGRALALFAMGSNGAFRLRRRAQDGGQSSKSCALRVISPVSEPAPSAAWLGQALLYNQSCAGGRLRTMKSKCTIV